MMGSGLQLAVDSKQFSESVNHTILVSKHQIGMSAGASCSKMFARGIFLVLGFLLLTTNLNAQTSNFDQLKERFESGEVFVADFRHTYTDSYTNESSSSEGKIWIDKVRYKLNSGNQTIVVDGETSRVYDSERNRVIIDLYEPEDDDFAPSRMLSGIDSTYTVHEGKQGSKFIIKLVSNDDFAVFSKVEIVLDTQLRPQRITAWDISDNKVVTTFSNGRFFEPESGLFQLEYPEDAEIVDMTY